MVYAAKVQINLNLQIDLYIFTYFIKTKGQIDTKPILFPLYIQRNENKSNIYIIIVAACDFFIFACTDSKGKKPTLRRSQNVSFWNCSRNEFPGCYFD